MRHRLRKFGNYSRASRERLSSNNLDFVSSGVLGPNLQAAAAALNCPPEPPAPGNTKASSSTLLSARVGISHNSQRLGCGPSPAPALTEVCVAGVN